MGLNCKLSKLRPKPKLCVIQYCHACIHEHSQAQAPTHQKLNPVSKSAALDLETVASDPISMASGSQKRGIRQN